MPFSCRLTSSACGFSAHDAWGVGVECRARVSVNGSNALGGGLAKEVKEGSTELLSLHRSSVWSVSMASHDTVTVLGCGFPQVPPTASQMISRMERRSEVRRSEKKKATKTDQYHSAAIERCNVSHWFLLLLPRIALRL